MKRFGISVLFILALLAAMAPAYAAIGTEYKVNGEDAVCNAEGMKQVIVDGSAANADGGRYVNFRVNKDTPIPDGDEGFTATFTVNIEEDGYYDLYTYSTQTPNDYFSPYNYKVDDGAYKPVAPGSTVTVLDESKSIYYVEYQYAEQFELSAGVHTVTLMVNTLTKQNPQYFMSVDYIKLIRTEPRMEWPNIRVEGENYSGKNFTFYNDDGSEKRPVESNSDKLSNGSMYLLNTLNPPQEADGYVVTYNVNIPQDGEYNILFNGSNVGNLWYSVYDYAVDGGEFIRLTAANTTKLEQNAAFPGDQGLFAFPTAEFEKGMHTISFRVNEISVNNTGKYIFAIDYIDFVKVGIRIKSQETPLNYGDALELDIEGSLRGQQMNAFDKAVISYNSNTPTVFYQAGDAAPAVTGPGAAEVEVVIKAGDEQQTAVTELKTMVNRIWVEDIVKSDAQTVRAAVYNYNETDTTVCLAAVLVDAQGYAYKVLTQEKTLVPGEGTIELAIDALAEGGTAKAFLIQGAADLTPLSQTYILK